MRRLKERGVEDGNGGKLHTKVLQLTPEVTKYLVVPPHCLARRYERELPVVIEQVRKGSGKGGSPQAVPKDILVAGCSSEQVDKCVTVLKTLDFSGTDTREVDRAVRISDLQIMEKELGVSTYRAAPSTEPSSKPSLTVYGPKAKVEQAFAKCAEIGKKAEGERPVTDTLLVEHWKCKVMMNGGKKSQLSSWQTGEVKIKVIEAPSPAEKTKILLSSKLQADVDAMKKKVEEFAKDVVTEIVSGDLSVLYEAFKVGDSVDVVLDGNRTRGTIEEEFPGVPLTYSVLVNGEPMTINAHKLLRRVEGGVDFVRRFQEELRSNSSVLADRRQDDSLNLAGPKKAVASLKANILDLLKKATYVPQRVPVLPEQARVFNKKEKLGQLEKISGADVRVNNDTLVILGDNSQIEKAKKAIEEVIGKEATVGRVDLTEDGLSALKGRGFAKIKEIEAKFSVSVKVQSQERQSVIVGSAESVEAVKVELTRFCEMLELGEMVRREIEVEPGHVGRLFGTGGSTLKAIRSDSGAQIFYHDETGTVEIKGEEAEVSKAEKAIRDLLESAAQQAVQAASKSRSRPVKKKVESYKGTADDFPTLGGAPASAENDVSPAPKAKWGAKSQWGSAAPPQDRPADNNRAEAFPALGGQAAEAPVSYESEEEHCPDAAEAPWQTKSRKSTEEELGMGEETVYKATHMEEAADQDVEAEQEEEEAGFYDPLAMLGGMGEEQVYKVTLMDEAPVTGVSDATPDPPMPNAWKGESAAAPTAPEPAAKEAPAPKKEEFNAADFPTLGGVGSQDAFPALGAGPGAAPAWGARPWGARAKAPAAKRTAAPEPVKESEQPKVEPTSPISPSKQTWGETEVEPTSPVSPAKQKWGEIEDEEEGTSCNPEEESAEAAPPSPSKQKWGEIEEDDAVQEEEEEAEFDDPLAMLGGMGEEQVYQVTQFEEAPVEKLPEPAPPAPVAPVQNADVTPAAAPAVASAATPCLATDSDPVAVAAAPAAAPAPRVEDEAAPLFDTGPSLAESLASAKGGKKVARGSKGGGRSPVGSAAEVRPNAPAAGAKNTVWS